MHLRRTWLPAAALLAGLTLVASACGSSSGSHLLVADDTSSGSGRARIWSVEPGDPLGSSSLVARNAVQPLSITTTVEDGTWDNKLGVAWKGTDLLAYQQQTSDTAGATALVTAGDPGTKAATLARTDGPLQAVVLNRGVAVVDQDGCRLASDPGDVQRIGRGRCQISADERWVVSWPAQPGALTIRDLRSGDVTVVKGIQTVSASALDRDHRVLAVEQVDGGVRGRMIDATDGSTVGRTNTYDAMQALPATGGAAGFVALARTGQDILLLWVATDGTATEIDRGLSLVPVDLAGGVSYLRLDQDASRDSIRRWTPGSDDPTVLLTGKVGAGVSTPGNLVATRQVEGGLQFFRTGAGDRLDQVFTLRTDTSQDVVVNTMQTQGDTSLLEVTSAGGTSFVRLDLRGDDSAAPMRNWPSLLLESIDGDGTALLTGRKTQEGKEQLLVVRPNDDGYQVRARTDGTGVNLIHDGVVYYTEQPTKGDISIRSVKATGDGAPELLYAKRQIAGSTWPQFGGAVQSQLMSRALIIQQQQQSQAQSQDPSSDATAGG